ncbi:MAG: aminotransferase class V-fold PLP-dependent enzyme [Actinomycetota bacterium]|nr:aminotransferase class V-fold PLP-dependent enzyme [Actinomycetota bacterium]
MTLDEVRSTFPVLVHSAYLNAGTFGPLARATVDAMAAWQRRDLEHGRSSRQYFEEALALREAVRDRLASLLKVSPTTIALTQSTTDSCQIVLGGLRLSPTDEVVTTDSEHFGLLGALHASGARVRVAAATADAVTGAVTPRTRLVAVSHVLWTTGNSLPVRALRDAVGLPVLVDGAQSVGAIEVDAAGVDFYTVSGQKWLCGPDTTGGLYVADPEALVVARPSYLSQESYEPDGAFCPRAGAARFDSGWIPPASLAGLVAAIDSAPEWRYERTLQAAAACRELLAERHEVVTVPSHGGLVSFRSHDDSAEVVARLHARDVVVRDVPGTGLVRASCGYWTSDGDLERLLDALDA